MTWKLFFKYLFNILNFKYLPHIYCLIKWHKRITWVRLIKAALKYSIESFSKSITKAFKLIYKHTKSCTQQCTFYSGIQLFWSIINIYPCFRKTDDYRFTGGNPPSQKPTNLSTHQPIDYLLCDIFITAWPDIVNFLIYFICLSVMQNVLQLSFLSSFTFARKSFPTCYVFGFFLLLVSVFGRSEGVFHAFLFLFLLWALISELLTWYVACFQVMCFRQSHVR